MSDWKVEKVFELDGEDITGIAADSSGDVYITTSSHLYRWHNGECETLFSGGKGLFSPTWDHKTNTLYCCEDSDNILQYDAEALRLVMKKDKLTQVVALDGDLLVLNADGHLFWRNARIYNRTSEESQKCICLFTAPNHVGAVSRTEILFITRGGFGHMKFQHDGLSSIVDLGYQKLMLASGGKLWMQADGKTRLVRSNLGILYLTRDQPLSDFGIKIFAASSHCLWKITRYGVRDIAGKEGQWKRLKLFLVGDGGAGKTSTLRWLMGQPFNNKPSRTDGAEVITTELRSWKQTSVDIKEHMAHLLLQEESKMKSKAAMFVDKASTENTKFVLQHWNSEDNSAMETNDLSDTEDWLDYINIYSFNITTDLPSFAEYEEKLLNDELPMTFHIWDFGGQEVYYNTHHFFLTEAAIYLLVMDLTQSTSSLLSRLQFWLHSIRSYSPSAPILIIGTHKEQITEHETQAKIKALWKEAQHIDNPPSKRHMIAISCKSGDLQSQTQRLLVELAEKETAKRTISFRYMLFFHALEKASANVQSSLTCLSLSDAREQAHSCGIIYEEDIFSALQCFHQLGFLMYYAENNLLNEMIFMQPTQLVDVLRAVVTITHTENSVENDNTQFGPDAPEEEDQNHQLMEHEDVDAIKRDGRLTNIKLHKVWSSYLDFIPQLRSLLQQFGLAVPDPNQADIPEDQRDLIVPCLVQSDMDSFPVLKQLLSNPQTVKLKLKGATQPLGLVSRIIVKALQMAQKTEEAIPACILFKGGCAFCYYGTYIQLIITAGTIKLHVQYSRSNQMPLEIKVAKKVLKELREFLTDIPFTEYITCFKCKLHPCSVPTQTFTCQICQMIALNTSDNNNNRKLDGPSIGGFRQDQWTSLGLLLDNNGDWRKLGEKLNKSAMQLDDIERRAKGSSPTKIMLTEWWSEMDANLMYSLIRFLQDIDNQAAATFLQQGALPQ